MMTRSKKHNLPNRLLPFPLSSKSGPPSVCPSSSPSSLLSPYSSTLSSYSNSLSYSTPLSPFKVPIRLYVSSSQGFGLNTSKMKQGFKMAVGSKGAALKEYGINLTELAKEGKLDPVIGREEEIRRTIQM